MFSTTLIESNFTLLSQVEKKSIIIIVIIVEEMNLK